MIDPVLSLEPWNEDATVIKMNCHAGSGARSLALVAYRSCAEALNCEFGIAPAAQTSRVYDQIRAAEPPGTGAGSAGLGAEQDPDHPRRQRPVQLGHPADAQPQLHGHGVISRARGRVPDQPGVDDLHRDH